MTISTVLDQLTCREALAAQIEAEFSEMPGLRLTEAQIRRRWLLSAVECAQVLTHLTDLGHFVKDRRGQYCRSGSSY